MKKILENRLFLVILTVIVVGSIGVYAATNIQSASQVIFENSGRKINATNIQKAVDDLYSKTTILNKICKLKSGTINTISSKYECTVGYDSNNTPIKYNFYLLAINNNYVKLIQEHNITEGTSQPTMTWSNAMKYVDNNNLRSKWANVLDIDLPMAQDVANAVGNTSWRVEDATSSFFLDPKDGVYGMVQVADDVNKSAYAWLYDYTRDCFDYGCNYSLPDTANSYGKTEAYGYWTRDMFALNNDTSNPHRAWRVSSDLGAHHSITNDTLFGVRLVINVLKSNLYQ